MKKKKKNKKGEVALGLGAIMVVFIAVLVGVVLFQTIAQETGVATSTVAVANESLGAAAVNDTAQYLTAYTDISSLVVYNETGDALVPSTNYTATANVVYNGNAAWGIVPNTTSNLKSIWQISGTAKPTGYVDDAGARAMANLIPLFFALAIAIVALVPTLRNEVLSRLGK